MRETRVRSLGREDPLEKEMAVHSSILAWRIPWTEKPSRLQSTGSQRVRHNWATSPSPYPISVLTLSSPSLKHHAHFFMGNTPCQVCRVRVAAAFDNISQWSWFLDLFVDLYVCLYIYRLFKKWLSMDYVYIFTSIFYDLSFPLKVLVTQSCPAFCDPIIYSPPDSSVHGILQARILEWVAMPSSRGSSQLRDRTHVS